MIVISQPVLVDWHLVRLRLPLLWQRYFETGVVLKVQPLAYRLAWWVLQGLLLLLGWWLLGPWL